MKDMYFLKKTCSNSVFQILLKMSYRLEQTRDFFWNKYNSNRMLLIHTIHITIIYYKIMESPVPS